VEFILLSRPDTDPAVVGALSEAIAAAGRPPTGPNRRAHHLTGGPPTDRRADRRATA
jgi:hypothetical protein